MKRFNAKGLATILLIVIVVLLLGAFGGLPGVSGHHWGYYPSGGLGLVLLILLVIWVAGGFRRDGG